MPRYIQQETGRLWTIVADNAPLFHHRPAVYQGKPHSQSRDERNQYGKRRDTSRVYRNRELRHHRTYPDSPGYADKTDISNEEALELYDKYMTQTKELMYAKNHDYDEAWRSMRISSYTDLILMKLYRTKQIEDHDGLTQISEGIDANYMDMVNYALFGLIKLDFGE